MPSLSVDCWDEDYGNLRIEVSALREDDDAPCQEIFLRILEENGTALPNASAYMSPADARALACALVAVADYYEREQARLTPPSSPAGPTRGPRRGCPG